MPKVDGIPGPYSFYFFSADCDEPRHVHVRREKRRCKIWLDPVWLAWNRGFSTRELNLIWSYIAEHEPKIRETWNAHCGRRL
jgi:hypothetical protein